MKVITLLNEKGGVGKTTLATHIATGLALKGHRVTLVDTDPQANATSSVGLDKRPSFYDLCVRDADWRDILVQVHPDVYSPPNSQSKGQLYCVPGNAESRTVAMSMKNRLVIRSRFQQLRKAIDFIVLDTSPTPSLLNEAILLATDYVLIPTDCESFSALEGLPESIEHIQNASNTLAPNNLAGPKVLGIIPNKYRSKTVLHRDMLAHLKNTYGDLVFEPIRLHVGISETQTVQQFLFAVAEKHEMTEQFWRLVNLVEGVKEYG